MQLETPSARSVSTSFAGVIEARAGMHARNEHSAYAPNAIIHRCSSSDAAPPGCVEIMRLTPCAFAAPNSAIASDGAICPDATVISLAAMISSVSPTPARRLPSSLATRSPSRLPPPRLRCQKSALNVGIHTTCAPKSAAA